MKVQCWFQAVIVLLITLVPGFGQAGGKVTVDDPEVYFSFCFFMESFSGWLDARNVAAPAGRTKRMQAAALYLKVDVSEIPKVTEVCQRVTKGLRQNSVDARKYIEDETSNRRTPDPTSLREFHSKRQVAIQGGVGELQGALSAKSWAGLKKHINGEHRAGLRVGTAMK